MALLITQNHLIDLIGSGYRFYIQVSDNNQSNAKITLCLFKTYDEATQFITDNSASFTAKNIKNLADRNEINNAIEEKRCYLGDMT